MNDNHEKTDDAGEAERGFGEFGGTVSSFHLILSTVERDHIRSRHDKIRLFGAIRDRPARGKTAQFCINLILLVKPRA